MRKRLRQLFFGLLVLLLPATVVLGQLSFRYSLEANWRMNDGRRYCGVALRYGEIFFEYERIQPPTDPLDSTGFFLDRRSLPRFDPLEEEQIWISMGQRFRFRGIAYAHNSIFGLTTYDAEAPLWPVTLAILIAVVVPALRWLKRRNRLRRGQCISCGYDVRS
jgi:hypothetical protein